MQQVKKQLQDAIKKLKSDWGINEVKREDLAAVLDKVVAALDRAAALPVQPDVKESIDKFFFRVVVLGEGTYNSAEGTPSSSYPTYPALAVVGKGPMKVQKGLFDPSTRNFYQDETKFREKSRSRILYNSKYLFSLTRDGGGYDYVVRGQDGSMFYGEDEVDDLGRIDWNF